MLDGMVAIVTGAAMGMGEATARVFAAAGAHVLVSDINAEAGEATAERIRSDGGDASFFRTDVSNAADADAMVPARGLACATSSGLPNRPNRLRMGANSACARTSPPM
jgi:NAD(P)-dependent dehydrogenase (short-subunit alcohol dehydrogenase family)